MFTGSSRHDVRMAFRGLLKTPGIALIVVMTLAVAIGANTAIFSVVENVLLRPLPYPDQDRIGGTRSPADHHQRLVQSAVLAQ